ncbi:hypothetical protein [uncultured Faecalibaculum sp.]|nr:hypothetical protein [uncultured Faecalibaculum sp.]
MKTHMMPKTILFVTILLGWCVFGAMALGRWFRDRCARQRISLD